MFCVTRRLWRGWYREHSNMRKDATNGRMATISLLYQADEMQGRVPRWLDKVSAMHFLKLGRSLRSTNVTGYGKVHSIPQMTLNRDGKAKGV